MSSRVPTTVRFSLEAFSRHGGLNGPHKDGWGIAHYDDGDVRLIKEAAPAAESACVRFVQDHPFTSALVISHIRKATQGTTALRNCQPFARELGGRMHVFAHNGHLEPVGLHEQLPLIDFHPVGETDSEHAFCGLLARLRRPWLTGTMPALAERYAIVAQFAAEMRALGPANFLYSDGDALFMQGHKRTHGEDHAIRPPGLHVLQRQCITHPDRLAAAGLAIDLAVEQSVILAASVPLTAEPGWRPLEEGELLVARAGELVPM